MNDQKVFATPEEVRLRQQQAREKLFEWSGGDIDRAKYLRYPCLFKDDQAPAGKKPEVPETDVQKMQALANKLLGRR